MSILIQPLAYEPCELEPYFSELTFTHHYEGHYKNYVTQLNRLIKDTSLNFSSLEEVIMGSANVTPTLLGAEILKNASQVWNHNFFWRCLQPDSDQLPRELTQNVISKNFGSIAEFKMLFNKEAQAIYGSGWTWLVADRNGQLTIQNYKESDLPLLHDMQPILACDLWEHSYYLDYPNDRERYLKNFWKVVNWIEIEANLHKLKSSRNMYFQTTQLSL